MTSPIQYSQDNPFAPKKVQGGFSADNPYLKEEEKQIDEQNPNPGFWERLGNHARYIQDIIKNPGKMNFSFSRMQSTGANLLDDLVDFGGKTLGDPMNAGTNLISDLATSDKNKEIIASIKQNPLQLIPGMIEGGVDMLESPIRLITGTKNELGQAVPATVEDQVNDIKTVAGIAAQSFAAGKVMSMLNPEVKGLEAVQLASKGKVGLLAREVAKGAIAQGAGGLALGATQKLGTEDMLATGIADALAFAPLGVVSGLSSARKITKAANEFKSSTPNLTAEAAAELSATKSLQIDNNSSIADINASIDAFATSDSRLEAAVRSNLTNGKGFIVDETVSPETIKNLIEEVSPSQRVHEGVFLPTEEIQKKLDNLKPVTSGDVKFPIEFKDPFDKAVWVAAKDKKIKTELMEQTGLSWAEIKSHKRQLQKMVSEKAVNGNVRARTQIEIDQLNNDIIKQGETKLLSTPEGQSFKDATGAQWIRNGNILTDGRQAIDINSNLAKQIAGRNPKDAKPESPVIDIEKQNFDGNLGRNPIAFHYYQSNRGTHLFYPSVDPVSGNPIRLNNTTETFFKETGFLPNEMVFSGGEAYVVRANKGAHPYVENFTTGEKLALDPTLYLTRRPGNLQSELYKNTNGEQIAKAGILNSDTFYSALWDRFKDQYKNDVNNGISYNDAIARFAKKMGMKNDGDISLLQKSFYKYAQLDAFKQLPIEEQNSLKGIQNGIKEWTKRYNNDLAQQTSNALHGNGFYLQSEGSGNYTIRDIQSGKVLQSVQSLDEALRFTNLSGQTKGLELDGGDSGIIPPSIGSLGQNFQIAKQGSWSKKLDLWNVDDSKWSVPPRAEFKSMDNLNLGKGRISRYSEMHEAMQTATAFKRLFATNQMKPFEKIFNERVVKPLEKVDPNRISIISDYIEALGLDEREVNPIEMEIVKDISNKRITKDVINFMKEVREGTDKPIGSPEFSMKLAEVSSKVKGKELLYSKEVVRAAQALFDVTQRFPIDKVSPFKILRRALGEENPDLAVNKKTFAARMKMSNEEIKIGDAAIEILDGAYDKFGLNPKTKIVGYLPWSKIAEATGNQQWKTQTNTQFVHELNRLGVNMLSTGLERNPATLVRNYLLAGTNTVKLMEAEKAFPMINTPNGAKAFENLGIKIGDKLSFNDVIKVAENYRDQMANSGDRTNQIWSAALNEHIADMKGIPNLSKRLEQAKMKEYELLFDKKDFSATRFALMIQHMAALGGRLGLTIRDISNAIQGTYVRYGKSVAWDMMNESINREYALELFEKGVFPSQTGLDLLMPGETLHTGMDRISKATNATMKYNGNIFAHYQTIGGLYKATMKQVGEMSSKMIKNEVNKAKAYEELGLEHEDPIIQENFDALVSSGKTVEAGELLAKERVKSVIGIYGSHNNPRSWGTTFGSLIGAMGSWGVNQAQTVASGLSRGSGVARTRYAARLALTNGALVAAGHYAGINMLGWLISPFSLVSTSPLFNTTVAAVKGANQLMSNDSRQRANGENELMRLVPHNDRTIAQLYLPYSFLLQDLFRAGEMFNNDFGPVAGLQAIGIRVNESDKSPLQRDLGLHPKVTDSKGRTRYLK